MKIPGRRSDRPGVSFIRLFFFLLRQHYSVMHAVYEIHFTHYVYVVGHHDYAIISFFGKFFKKIYYFVTFDLW